MKKLNEKGNFVRTYKDRKLVYENYHRTAETAYEEYLDIIARVKKYGFDGNEFDVARFNDGYIMTIETFKK